MLSLTVLAFATFFAHFMFSQIRFENDPYRAKAHYMLGRFQSTLILLWMLVFIASFMRHKQRALWALMLVPLLLIAYVLWGFWTCC
jgi:hypothetical protein